MRALLLVTLLANPASAGDACEGIVLKEGVVNTARQLVARAPTPAVDLACAKAVGARLAERGGVRSVTVAVRLPDAMRVDDRGEKIAQAYAAAMVEGGVPEARVSTVVPAAAKGEENTVALSFTERRAKRPVARVDSTEGKLRAGKDAKKMKAAKAGQSFKAQTWVATGAASATWLGLADGSRLKLLADTTLKLGRMSLNADLKREVKLELKKGKVEAEVRSGGKGSKFEIATGAGLAGVRGTTFRMAAGGDGTRLETLHGEVEISSGGKTVKVKEGFASKVKPGAPPAEPKALIDAPEVIGPFKGKIGGAFGWKKVDCAEGYRVDLARDAEFTYSAMSVEVEGTALKTKSLAKKGVKLTSGKWFWRVAGTDDEGFGGRTS